MMNLPSTSGLPSCATPLARLVNQEVPKIELLKDRQMTGTAL